MWHAMTDENLRESDRRAELRATARTIAALTPFSEMADALSRIRHDVDLAEERPGAELELVPAGAPAALIIPRDRQ